MQLRQGKASVWFPASAKEAVQIPRLKGCPLAGVGTLLPLGVTPGSKQVKVLTDFSD